MLCLVRPNVFAVVHTQRLRHHMSPNVAPHDTHRSHWQVSPTRWAQMEHDGFYDETVPPDGAVGDP